MTTRTLLSCVGGMAMLATACGGSNKAEPTAAQTTPPVTEPAAVTETTPPTTEPAETAETATLEAPKVQAGETPEGMHNVNVQLVVLDIPKAVSFYQKAFGATKKYVGQGDDGKPSHAEVVIGDSVVKLIREKKEWNQLAPKSMGGTPATLHLYVKDADATYKSAKKAGAKVQMAMADQFWGDRYGMVADPSGHVWGIASRVADLSEQEMANLAQQQMADAKKKITLPRKPGVEPIPAGYNTVTPSLVVPDAAAAIDFYTKSLGFTEEARMPNAEGKIMHATLKLGDARLFLADPMMGMKTAQQLGGSPVDLLIFVSDVDAAYEQALAAGAKSLEPVAMQDWGARYARITGPYGFNWGIATYTPGEEKPAEQAGGTPDATDKSP